MCGHGQCSLPEPAVSRTTPPDFSHWRARPAPTPGTVDASGTPSGTFVYVLTGANGIVDEYQVAPGGSLTEMGSVVVAGAVGGEGIVAF